MCGAVRLPSFLSLILFVCLSVLFVVDVVGGGGGWFLTASFFFFIIFFLFVLTKKKDFISLLLLKQIKFYFKSFHNPFLIMVLCG